MTNNELEMLNLLNKHNDLTIQRLKGNDSGQLMSGLDDNHRQRVHVRLMGFVHANKTWHSAVEI